MDPFGGSRSTLVRVRDRSQAVRKEGMMNADPVLLVAFDPQQRSRIGGWLEDDGFDVLMCPGPLAPDYTCLGGRGEACPLANEASIVVLDMRLAPDELMTGTPGWQILMYYVAAGMRVVAISGELDAFRPRPDDQVSVLQRPARREDLISAVRELRERTPARPERKGQPLPL